MSLLDDLAAANHILYDQGVLDGFGHVSSRNPAAADEFFLARNMAPALVKSADVLSFDLNGNVRTPGDHKIYLERFIHAAIYRLRPDVQSVVHSHAASILPFGAVTGLALCPICHMSGFLRRASPIYEIRADMGPASDLLIRNLALGEQLARKLGDHPVVLMRGHGMTVVGESVKQAVFRAVYTVVNAEIQMAASQTGTPEFLTDKEASAADAANHGQMDRAWEFWRLRAAAAVSPLHALTNSI